MSTQAALDKLRAEMTAAKNNQYVQVIGQFLLGYLEEHSDSADKLAAADKTIAKSLDAMKAEAKKKQSNGMAMLTDAEGFAIVLSYYGIKGSVTTQAAAAAITVTSAPAAKTAGTDFEVSLDDFL
ncbi:hypothetical protein DFQ01_121107 [Paenibacillus cellulosilyticus]|uniref:Uncharacterized protein n=1 Tax=Paenibacillus cellulosilyticus TaxID=375489 RepID=A0A2V2YXW6_9BACL|nr:hypothetical protein [Paenibacillus cellulosilyticus]PWV97463.1 hypothetical protein DFQ01_121107 [Paenibacillus cellulosilyticus]QKS48500.1 hypothetical protein HUB94_30155 [Paenibacillus cellulosilyticus]